MVHYFGKYFLLFSILWVGCLGNNADNQLIVRKENTVLREQPDEKSKEIKALKLGEKLLDQDQTAAHESVLKAGNTLFQSPWIKVSTIDQVTGWILAWSVKPVLDDKDWLLKKRISTYWGTVLLHQREQLVQSCTAISTEADWLQSWQSAFALRDTMVDLLSRQPLQEKSLDFQWTEAVLPGFVFQRNGTTGYPFLFADFKFWQKKALATPEKQDNILLDLYLQMFPSDSIESPFPVWTFQLGDQAFASQLGLGKHLFMLEKLQAASTDAPILEKECQQIKNLLLEDILDRNRQYWQSVDLITRELDAILNHQPALISTDEMEAIRIRKAMFVQAAVNGIRVNMRSGY